MTRRQLTMNLMLALLVAFAMACDSQAGGDAKVEAPTKEAAAAGAKGADAKAEGDKAEGQAAAKGEGKPGAIATPKKDAPAKDAAAKDAPAAEVAEVGKAAPEFSLTDEAGKVHKLSDYKGKIVVLEWTCATCPFVVRHYEDKTMSKTHEQGGEDVVWLSVNSSHFAKADEDAAWKKKEGFSYPVLQDPSGDVGRLYGARTTPHMYVVDKEGKLAYNGAIDDNPRGKNESPKNYVLDAINALKEGKPVETSSTKPYGCSVKYKG